MHSFRSVVQPSRYNSSHSNSSWLACKLQPTKTVWLAVRAKRSQIQETTWVKGSRHCSPCKPFVVSERGWTTWRNSWRLFSRQCWDERQRRVKPLGEGALPILLSLWVMQVWLCAKRPCTGPWPLLQATTRPTTKRPCTVSVQHGTDHKTNSGKMFRTLSPRGKKTNGVVAVVGMERQ